MMTFFELVQQREKMYKKEIKLFENGEKKEFFGPQNFF